MLWIDIKKQALKAYINRKLDSEYLDKLKFEFKEIEKQGAEDYWINLLSSGKHYKENKNGLLLPWLLDITTVDPIVGESKLMVNDGDINIDCIEIILEDGRSIQISEYTKILTNRGFLLAKELLESDEIVVSN